VGPPPPPSGRGPKLGYRLDRNTPTARRVIWFASLARVLRHHASQSIAMIARHDALCLIDCEAQCFARSHRIEAQCFARSRGIEASRHDVSEGDRGNQQGIEAWCQWGWVHRDRANKGERHRGGEASRGRGIEGARIRVRESSGGEWPW